MRSHDRTVRIAAALIAAAGLAASGLAILAGELGVGAEAARETFGWKRITLLAVGGAALAIGVLVLARPRIASALVDWERTGPLDRYIRFAAAAIVAAGLAASALAILADELGVGAEAARGTFGWKRIGVLVAGGIGLTVGALFVARPQIVSRRVDWERMRACLRQLSDRYPGYLAVGLLTLLGLVLLWTRLIHISESLWHDEAYSILNHNGLTAAFGLYAHVFYNQLSWATTSLLGESEAMHRLWSVVPGIAAVGLGTWWAWRRVGAAVAVAFAALAVAAPMHFHHVPQARGYGLALLAATVMLITADRLTRTYSKRALLGFLAAGLVGIWTLIIFAFGFVGQVLSLLRWPRLRRAAVGVLAVAAVLSFMFHRPGQDFGQVAGETISLSEALLLERTLDWLVVPIVTLLRAEPAAPQAHAVATHLFVDHPLTPTWAGVAALALVVLAVVALWLRKDAGLALMLVLPPLFFNLAFSIGGLNTVARHQIALLPHVLLLVAIGIAELGGIVARVRALKPVVVAAGVIAVLALSNAAVQEEQARALPLENFKEVADVARGAGMAPIVTDSNRPEGLRYYLGEDLIELPPEEIESMLCENRQVVYIRHLYANSPASLRCVKGTDSVRVRVWQRDRGRFIDVWIVRPETGTRR